MVGLRTFLKDFSKTTQLAPFDTLYERQRELVRCGLLPSVKGRGPGSGVPLNAETLATFLISLLASDKLADLGERTHALCEARPVIHPKNASHRLGKENFHHGVSRALLQERVIGKRSTTDVYTGVQVTRPWRGIILQERKTATQGLVSVEYFTDPEGMFDLSLTMHNISIEGPVFSWLSQRLWDYMEFYYNIKSNREGQGDEVPSSTGTVINLMEALKDQIRDKAGAVKKKGPHHGNRSKA